MDNYKSIISSSMISDVLDEMGYTVQVLPIEIKPNLIKAKICGRVRTMTLKQLEIGDDFRDIYRSLYFVDEMNKGEVLLVANAFPNLAFFGELMSTLAVRRGVEGVIVDGCTRDYVETVELEFPVFSRINYAKDIKKRGIIKEFDMPAKVGDVIVNSGDLIFGDYDGVVVIPKIIEREVLDKCLVVADLELRIKEDLKKGVSITDLLKNRGDF